LWGALLCGLLAATELEMSILLAAPGKATLGIRLYSLIHTAPASTVAALTLGIILLISPAVVVLLLVRPFR
jgi:ABC-type spermidine/putrescine transport system permease subunit II